MGYRVASWVVIAVVAATSAGAETPAQTAARLVDEGNARMERNDPSGACAKFEAALRVDPTQVSTMLALGRCNEQLGKLSSAIHWYRKAEATAAESKLEDAKLVATEHAIALAPRVPAVALVVTGAATPRIRIDDIEVSSDELSHVELDPGEHRLVGRAPGMRAVHLPIVIREASRETVAVAFTEPAVPVYADRGASRRHTGLILTGVGVLALTGTVLYVIHEKAINDDTTLSPSARNEAQTNARYIGTGGFLVSAGAIAAGVILYIGAPGRVQVSDGTALAPLVGDGQYGLAMTRGF